MQRIIRSQKIYPRFVRAMSSSATNCSLVTVPLTFGQPHAGADIAPIQLINSGLLKQLKNLGMIYSLTCLLDAIRSCFCVY